MPKVQDTDHMSDREKLKLIVVATGIIMKWDTLHWQCYHPSTSVCLCVYVCVSGRHCIFSQFSANHSQLLLAAYSLPAKVRRSYCILSVLCLSNSFDIFIIVALNTDIGLL